MEVLGTQQQQRLRQQLLPLTCPLSWWSWVRRAYHMTGVRGLRLKLHVLRCAVY